MKHSTTLKLLAVFLSLSINNVFSQHERTYNFLTHSHSFTSTVQAGRKDAVKLNEVSIFKITDINTFLYEVKVEGKEVSFNTEPPAVFQLFFDTEKFAKPDNKSDGAAGAAAIGGTISVEVGVYQLALAKLEFTKQLYDNMLMLIQTDDKSQAAIKAEILTADPNQVILQNSGPNSRVMILTACQKKYDDVVAAYSAVKGAYMRLDPAQKGAEIDKYADVTVKQGKVENFDYTELFRKLALLYDQIDNPLTFSVFSGPIVAQTDQINYLVEITPKKDLKYGTPKRTEKFSVPVLVKGGAKVDFSTGLFFTLTPEVYDRSYRLDSLSKTEKEIRENSARNSFIPSIGAMMHVSPRWISGFKPCLSFGLGVKSTNLENASYYLGLGLILGHQERVVISGGWTGTRVSYLKSSYEVGNKVPFKTKQEDLADKAFRHGFGFVSLTYNLTNKKKEQ